MSLACIARYRHMTNTDSRLAFRLDAWIQVSKALASLHLPLLRPDTGFRNLSLNLSQEAILNSIRYNYISNARLQLISH